MTLKKFGKMNISKINTQFQELPANSEMQVRQLVAAIKRGEKMPPILVSRAGYLQDGRHRLTAYKRLGLTEIEVEYGHHPAAKVVERRSNRS
jgi:ParB-like chromosome segregation protein Spo0J